LTLTEPSETMPSFSATGRQLSQHLNQYQCILHGGELPPWIGRPIAKALKKADQQIQRKATLEAILARLEPCGPNAKWHNALWIADGMAALRGTRLRGIQSGRLTATPMESLLCVLMELPGPKCHERIFRELKRLASLRQ